MGYVLTFLMHRLTDTSRWAWKKVARSSVGAALLARECPGSHRYTRAYPVALIVTWTAICSNRHVSSGCKITIVVSFNVYSIVLPGKTACTLSPLGLVALHYARMRESRSNLIFIDSRSCLAGLVLRMTVWTKSGTLNPVLRPVALGYVGCLLACSAL